MQMLSPLKQGPRLARRDALKCSRCACFTDDELRHIHAEPKRVGPFILTGDTDLGPFEAAEALTPTERRLAVMLVRAYPYHATYPVLLTAGDWEIHSRCHDHYHYLRVNVHRMRSKLLALGLRLEVARNYGYRLVVEGENDG